MRAAFKFWAGLMALAVVVQITFVGLGGFHAAKQADKHSSITEDSFNSWFGPHIALGYLLVPAALILVILAAVGARNRLKWSLGALGLMVLQVILAWLAYSVPALGWIHPLNALAILGTMGSLAMREWRPAHAHGAPPATNAAV